MRRHAAMFLGTQLTHLPESVKALQANDLTPWLVMLGRFLSGNALAVQTSARSLQAVSIRLRRAKKAHTLAVEVGQVLPGDVLLVMFDPGFCFMFVGRPKRARSGW